MGIEPMTQALLALCSTTELIDHIIFSYYSSIVRFERTNALHNPLAGDPLNHSGISTYNYVNLLTAFTQD